ncbi:MAG: hypothetical protein HY331_13140 [Chloroflexi bacterium]|nr:hypothetical protein [Chloroflexota bacterium]
MGLAVLALAGLLFSGLFVPSPLTWGAAGPPLVLDPVPVQQGGRLRVAGRGFFPGESIELHAGQATAGRRTVDLRQSQANLRGLLEPTDLALPADLTSGTHLLEAVGQLSRRRSTAVLYVRAREPWITLGTAEVKPFERLGLVAGGFKPGERVVVSLEPKQEEGEQASRSSAEPAGPVELGALSTDPAGNTAWSELIVPRADFGTYVLVARGESGGQELRRDVTVNPVRPSVELSPWAGPPGTKVQMNAQGFAPGERVRVYFGTDPREAVTLDADQHGNFWGAGPAPVPYAAGSGPLTVTLIGEDSRAFATLEFKVLAPKPWLELTMWWGPPGTPVGFSGGGWAAGERVSFHVGSAGAPAVGEGQADDYGWLRAGGAVSVPADTAASVTFVAVGQESGATASASFKIVYPFGLAPPETAPGRSSP